MGTFGEQRNDQFENVKKTTKWFTTKYKEKLRGGHYLTAPNLFKLKSIVSFWYF